MTAEHYPARPAYDGVFRPGDSAASCTACCRPFRLSEPYRRDSRGNLYHPHCYATVLA